MNASDILQRYLDRIAAAVLQDDWPTYQDGVVLPFHLVTHSANITIATTAELRAGFEAFHQTLQAQKVTDYVRLVETAKQLQ